MQLQWVSSKVVLGRKGVSMRSREEPVQRVPSPHSTVVGRQHHRQDQDGDAAGVELDEEVPLALRPALS